MSAPAEGGAPPAGDAPSQGGVPERSIGRRDLEAIIRRAAELTVRSADADERLSEADLLRIGEEVGLPARHVLQALHERPELHSDPSLFGKYFEDSVVVVNRELPGEATATARRVEKYLATHEYLRVLRSRDGNVLLAPADDTLSSLARVFTRPAKRHHLARARRVALAAQPLEEGATHLRLEVDLGEQRRDVITTGVAVGSGLGLAVGGLGAGLVALAGEPGSAVMIGGIVGSLATGTLGGLATGVALASRAFRTRVREARLELEGLLDRLERGDRLEPPPPPWRQKLRDRFLGS